MATTGTQQMSGWVGWIGFAGIVMAVSGILHIVYGLAGIFSQDWYANLNQVTLVMSLDAWGWSMLAMGALLLLSASLLLAGNMFGRVMGAILVTASLFANLALLSVTPVWSVIAVVVDLLVLYAIIFHGSELKEPDSSSPSSSSTTSTT